MPAYKNGYCDINGFTPNQSTTKGIEDMERIAKLSQYLRKRVIGIPFYQIFAGRDTYAIASMASMARNLQTQDWEVFSDALKGIGNIKKRRLENIVDEKLLFSTGKERDFWRCISNAL